MDRSIIRLIIVSLLIFWLTSCGHLKGGYVTSEESAKGVRYYLPRSQFLLEQEVKDNKINAKLTLMRVPDHRRTYHVYLKQGLFSSDIFDVQLNDQGLLTSVSGDTTDSTIESAQSVASFAIGLAFPETILGTRAESEVTSNLAYNRLPILLAAYEIAPTIPKWPSCSELMNDVVENYSLRTLNLAIGALNSMSSDLKRKYVALNESSKASVADVIVKRVALIRSLPIAKKCLLVLNASSTTFRNKLNEKIYDDDWKTSKQFIMKQLMLEMQEAKIGVEINNALLLLYDGVLALSPDEITEELDKLGKSEDAERLKEILSQEEINIVQKNVRQAVPACGCPVNKKDLQDLQTLGTIVRLMEANVNCMVKAVESEDAKIGDIPKALTLIDTLIELILEPTAGYDKAKSRATSAITYGKVDIDEDFEYDIALHKILRSRDRFKEFMWRRSKVDNQLKFYKKKVKAVEEAMSRVPKIIFLLKQRAIFRKFLLAPLDEKKAKELSSVREELENLEQKIEKELTVSSVTVEVVKKRITPQVIWVTRTSKVPDSGSKIGQPGEVYIVLRPL